MEKLKMVKSITLLIVLFSSVNIYSQELLSNAWEMVNSIQLEKSLNMFLEDAEKNSSIDSYLAAAYIEEILTQNENSLMHFLEALKIEENAAPYLVAAMQSPRIASNLETNPSIIKLLKELAEKTKDGFIKVYMLEKIGKYYERIAQLDTAKLYFNRIGAVKTWDIIGPFENISGSGYYNEFPPEREFNDQKKYLGKESRLINWFEPEEYRTDGWLDFLCYFSEPNSIFYGNTFIYSEEKQKIQIRVGTSGSLRTFLNDQLILETSTETNNNSDTFIAETFLQKGWNRLLIKVGYSEIDYCNFMVRITDESGFNKNNLLYSSDRKGYSVIKNEEVKLIKSEVESFFENRLKLHPENPINYLLLGEAYSINHKSYQAELIYKEGMNKFPENILFPIHLAGRYMRDYKSTLYYTLIDMVDKRSDEIPLIIESKLNKEMAEKNKESFTSLFEKYKSKLVDSATSYKYFIFYHAIQGKVNELVTLVDSAYSKFPNNYEFVFFKANLDYSRTRNFGPTIKILEDYTLNHYSPTALKYLLSLYKASSDWDKWRSVYNTLLKFEPAEANYYYEMAQTLYQTMDYQNAISALNSAIKISPFNSDYHFLLGLCQIAIGEKKEGLNSFKTAIQNNYTNYEARDQVKLITNNSDSMNYWENMNIDEIISTAPGEVEYPSYDAVTIENNLYYNIYDGRASEYIEELLVRVLNENGVDWYSNVTIPYFSNQTINIEKAQVIKKDGSKIEGEISESQIVFKSLEKNDFIYIKYKLRNYNKGLLSGHFWEARNLGSFQPVKKLRLSVLMPENESLIIKTLNMEEKPTEKKIIGSNKLFVWEKENIPAVEYEYYMPTTFDLGPNIYFSTINDWNLVARWYFDITRSKISPHYEITNKVAELLRGKENLSEREKIRIIYEFITKEISYVSVPFLQSDYVPQKASDILINKIGDCKDVVTLFIAMLKEIGIRANYVLVRTIDEGRLLNVPPGMYFNHVIAVTYLDDKKQYYDLTAKDHTCYFLPETLDGVLALEIENNVQQPFFLENDIIKQNQIERKSEVTINDNLSATLSTISTKWGESAAEMRTLYKGISYEQRMKKLTEIFSTELTNFTINSFNIDNLDVLADAVPYNFNVTLNSFLNKTGNYRMFKIPWNDGLRQNTALSYTNRKFPYLIYNQPHTTENIKIIIPKSFKLMELPENVSLTCDDASYIVSYSFQAGVLNAFREFKILNRNITPEDYSSFKDFYNKVLEADNVQILLQQYK